MNSQITGIVLTPEGHEAVRKEIERLRTQANVYARCLHTDLAIGYDGTYTTTRCRTCNYEWRD